MAEAPRQDRTPDLLVTLADRHYLEAAKQLFSSAYHNAGWRGDYLLLAHDVAETETRWFTDRGILVRHCRPIFTHDVGGRPAVLTSKLYLFTSEFRRWRTIIYVDADCAVRFSLDDLIRRVSDFHGVVDWNPTLKWQIVPRRELSRRNVPERVRADAMRPLSAYRRSAPAFCAGFFAFNSSILAEDTFDTLLDLMRQVSPVSRFGDQLALNLHFYRRWQPLSPAYHLMVHNGQPPWPLRPDDVQALIVHFVGETKPWHDGGAHHEEWARNLARADEIDLRAIPPGRRWSPEEFARTARSLSTRSAIGNLARRCRAFLCGVR